MVKRKKSTLKYCNKTASIYITHNYLHITYTITSILLTPKYFQMVTDILRSEIYLNHVARVLKGHYITNVTINKMI